jgi:hypothetical protein
VLGTYGAGEFVDKFSSALELARAERTEGLRVGEAATLRFLADEDSG